MYNAEYELKQKGDIDQIELERHKKNIRNQN